MMYMNDKKLLVIMAHPDDAELLCYGTIARHLAHGGQAKLLIVTDGSKAGQNRMEETRAAFRGKDMEIACLGLEDGDVPMTLETNTLIRSAILDYAPNCIITHYPDVTGSEHQDHTVVSHCVISIVSKVACPVEELLLTEPLISEQTDFKPNCFVEMTQWEKEKIRAVGCHKSQAGKYYMQPEFLTWRDHRNSFTVPMKDPAKAYESFVRYSVVL